MKTPAQPRPPWPVFADPYAITTGEARTAVASGLHLLTDAELSRLSNQLENFELAADERRTIEDAMHAVKHRSSIWTGGMAVFGSRWKDRRDAD